MMQFTPFLLTDRPQDDGVDHAIATYGGDDPAVCADLRLAYRFIDSYKGSKDTYAAYRREVEKLLQWQAHCRPSIPVRRLRVDDLEAFFRFCSAPPDDWRSPKIVQRTIDGRPNPAWKPFMGGTDGAGASQKSLRALFAIVSSFYDYLTNEGAAEYNPVLNIRQKSKFFTRYAKPKVMRITNLQVEYLFRAVDRMALNNPARGERDRWIVSLLLHAYLRISELVKHDHDQPPTMGIFSRDEDGNWWLSVIGKGRKERYVTVGEELEHSLIRFRRHLGLSDYPTPGESTPLIPASSKGSMAPLTSARYIRDLITALYGAAHTDMVADGLANDAAELKAATVHWLRHTGISEDVKRRPKDHVKEDAGHASLATTENYIDIERKERARSKKNGS